MGEYTVKVLFDSSNGDFDIQKKHINNKGNFVITAGVTDNGILGKTDVGARIFEENTITIDMFRFAFYRNFKYKMVTHARVFSFLTNEIKDIAMQFNSRVEDEEEKKAIIDKFNNKYSLSLDSTIIHIYKNKENGVEIYDFLIDKEGGLMVLQ